MDTAKEQIDVVRSYLLAMRQAIKNIGVYPRNPERYMFDAVIFGTLSKAFSVADAALVLVENRHPEEGFGLTRTLVECTLNLRYLTQERAENEARALAFTKFFFKEKQYWLHQAKEFFEDEPEILAGFQKYAAENDIVPDDRGALKHWSGTRKGFTWEAVAADHPLDGGQYTLRKRKMDFEIGYHLASSYVHGSHTAIESFFPEVGGVYVPSLTSEGDEQQGQKTLYTVVRHIHQAARYTLLGAQIDPTGPIDELFRETYSRLTPPRRRHRP